LRSRFLAPISIVLGIAGLVLLIACVNLATLTFSRVAARQSEIAVRMALGGTRLRLARQLLTEGFLLSMTGAFGAIVVATLADRAFSRIAFAGYLVPISF